MADYDITQRDDGKWQATTLRASRASSVQDTQREAQQDATRLAGNSGGGEVRIHGTDGRIRNTNAIGKPDPKPPRDRKH